MQTVLPAKPILTLRDLRAYMRVHGTVHLPELIRHFQSDAQTLKPLLAHWERKGMLKRYFPPACGSQCVQCLPELRLVYRWYGG